MRFERYNRIASYYATMWPLLVPGYVPLMNALPEILRARKFRPKRVLDVGCGVGAATVAVSSACAPYGRATLVDGSHEMVIRAASLLHKNLDRAIEADFTDPTLQDEIFPKSTYDLVLCTFSLHHLVDEDKAKVIKACYGCLNDQGVLLLVDEVTPEGVSGWHATSAVRSTMIHKHMESGRIPQDFWDIETSLPKEFVLPFLPARHQTLLSAMKHAGFHAQSPVSIFGSDLLVGVKEA